MISLLIYLIVVGIIIALVFYVIDAIPVPEPFNKIIKIVGVVICCLIIIQVLLQLAGVAVPLRLQ